MNPDAINRIERYVAAGIPPVVESLLADAHAFIWDTNAPEDADFAIVNRNGNFARAVQERGVWSLYRGLGKHGFSIFSPASWEFTSISGPCLRECSQRMWLPDSSDEKLTFLPKDLTPPSSRRRVIVRDQLFLFRGSRDDTFKLELGGVTSPDFQGKPWESRQAVDWAVARCKAPDAPKGAEAVVAAMQHQQAVVAAEDALAGLWGQF